MGRGENRSTRRKPPRVEKGTNKQTQPTYDAESGNRTRDTLVGGECSQHYATTAYPAEWQKNITENLVIFINTESVKHSMEEQCAFKSPLVCSLEADTSFFADEYIFQAGTVAVISWVIIH